MPTPILYNTLEYRPDGPGVAGQELPLASWGRGLRKMSIDFISQDTDVGTFTQAGSSIDDAPLFDPDATCVIRQKRIRNPNGTFSGGRCLFLGRVVKVPGQADGKHEQLQYVLHGPWWYLLNRSYELEYITVASIVDGVKTYLTQTSGHLWLNRDINRNWLCTGEQIQAALQWVISKGAPIALLPDVAVPLNVGFTLPIGRTAQISAGIKSFVDVPIDEVVDMTCAEVINKQVRWNPDCVTWFDYTTVDGAAGKPTFYCYRRQYLTPVNMRLLVGNDNTSPEGATISVSASNISPRYDLQRPFVTIAFETYGTINGEQEFSLVKQSFPNPPPTEGEDSFGGLTGTVRLQGISLNVIQASVHTNPVPALDESVDNWEALMALVARRHSFLTDGTTIASWGIIDEITDANNQVTQVPPKRNGALGFYIANGSGQIPAWVKKANGSDWLHQEDTVTVYVEITGRDGSVKTRRLDIKLNTTDLDTGGVVKYYQKTSGTPTSDLPPPTLAKDLYDSLSFLQFSGDATWKATECDVVSCWLGNTLSFSDTVRYAGMNAIVQSVKLDIDDGKTSVKFGPNKILAAGEYVTLLKVTRNRVIIGDQGNRNAQTQASGDSGTTDIGTSTPIDGTNAGAGHDPVVCASDSPVGANNAVALVGGTGTGQFASIFGLIISRQGDRLIVLNYADALGNQIRFRYVPVWVQNPDGTCTQMKQMFPCGPVVAM